MNAPDDLNAAILAQMNGDFALADRLYSHILNIDPGNVDALYLNGRLQIQLGKFYSSRLHLAQVVCCVPNFAQAYFHLGETFSTANMPELAIRYLRRVIACDPAHLDAYIQIQEPLIASFRIPEVIADCIRALCLNPAHQGTSANLGIALVFARAIQTGLAWSRRALSIQPKAPGLFSNLILNSHYSPKISDEEISRLAREFGSIHSLPGSSLENGRRQLRRGEKLRIGYVSGDFRLHPIFFFLRSILENHNRQKVEIYCISTSRSADDMTRVIQQLTDKWVNISGIDDVHAAAMIKSYQIDILVDLSGHTAGGRLPMFAFRPAPIQVSWLGYWGSTGCPFIDYLISDQVMLPVESQALYTETVVHLPAIRMCYAPPNYAPAQQIRPEKEDRTVNFGSFNNFSKLSGDVVQLWSSLLLAVPGSRLILKWFLADQPSVLKPLQDLFQSYGVAADRLEFRGASPHEIMLGEYKDIDVALDPFPFSGGTTTCEALWMGVPVITLPGELPISRQSAGILSAIGQHQLIARSAADYIRIASELSADFTRLYTLRTELRRAMASSDLCNGPKFVRNLERVFFDMAADRVRQARR